MSEFQIKLNSVPSGGFLTDRDKDTKPILNERELGIDFAGLTAVDGFNLMIGRNEITDLIGPNGAGKPTVFNLLTNVYQPSSRTSRMGFLSLSRSVNKPPEGPLCNLVWNSLMVSTLLFLVLLEQFAVHDLFHNAAQGLSLIHIWPRSGLRRLGSERRPAVLERSAAVQL